MVRVGIVVLPKQLDGSGIIVDKGGNEWFFWNQSELNGTVFENGETVKFERDIEMSDLVACNITRHQAVKAAN